MAQSSESRHRRPSKAQLSAVEREFEAVAAAAAVASSDDEAARLSLDRALDVLFGFGERFRGRQGLLEGFLRSRRLPWNKVTQINPYNGLVRLAFPSIGKASVSQYSRVLRLAHDTKQGAKSLVEWLGEGGGLEGRYREAVGYFNPRAREVRESAKRLRLAVALEHLAKTAISPPVELSGSRPLEHGYATALVRIAEGHAVIVALLEQDKEKLEPVLLEFGPPGEARRRALAANPLSQLHEAIDLVTAITPNPVRGNERLVLLENGIDDGVPICRVSATSAAHTFPFARVTFPHHVAGLGPSGRYLLDAAGAKQFVQAFPGIEEWRLDASGEEGACRLTSTRCTMQLQPLGSGGTSSALRTAARPLRHTKHFTLTADAMAGYLRWIDGVRARAAKRNRSRTQAQGMSNRLDLVLAGGALAVSLEDVPNNEVALFSLSDIGQLAPERWLSVTDVEAVCRALEPRDIQADGSFVDMEIVDAGVELRAQLDRGAALGIVLPAVISRGMDYAQTCEDIAHGRDIAPTGERKQRARKAA